MILPIVRSAVEMDKATIPWRRKTLAPEGKLRENDSSAAALPVELEEPRVTLIETSDSLQTEKIIRIREQIAQGTYHIAAAEVAKAILRSGTSRLLLKRKEK